MSLEKKEKVDFLMLKYGGDISDELELKLNDVPSGNFDYCFEKENDKEIIRGDLKIIYFQTEVIDDQFIDYELKVEQNFSISFIYEDKEGDRIPLGEVEVLVSAIVLIKAENAKDLCLDKLALQTKSKYPHLTTRDFSYKVVKAINMLV